MHFDQHITALMDFFANSEELDSLFDVDPRFQDRWKPADTAIESTYPKLEFDIHFDDCDFVDNVFHFDSQYFCGLGSFMCITGALATAIVNSDRMLNIFVRNIVDMYHPIFYLVKDATQVKARLRKLLSGEFFVTPLVSGTMTELVCIRRDKPKRVIFVNERIINRLRSFTAARGSDRQLVRHTAILLGGVLARQALHWLHTMTKPRNFYADAALTTLTTNTVTKEMRLREFAGVLFTDFGVLMDSAYYGGALCVREPLDALTGLPLHCAVAGVKVLILSNDEEYEENGKRSKRSLTYNYVEMKTEPKGVFQAATYSGDGGLVLQEVKEYKKQLLLQEQDREERKRKKQGQGQLQQWRYPHYMTTAHPRVHTSDDDDDDDDEDDDDDDDDEDGENEG